MTAINLSSDDLLEALPFGAAINDRDMRLLRHNRAFEHWCERYGLSRPVLGESLRVLFPMLPQETFEVTERIFATGVGEDTERHLQNPAGRDIWVKVRRLPVMDNGRVAYVLTLIRDLTDRRRAEASLEISEKRYQFLFEESPAGSLILGADGRIQDVNRAFTDKLGYAREDLIGKAALDYVPDSQRAHLAQVITTRFQGQPAALADTLVLAKDGTVHSVAFAPQHALFKAPDGSASMLLVGIDVTEQRKAEELARQRRDDLLQAAKLASLGELVAGVAHEINNPNNFIRLNADNLADIWQDMLPLLDELDQREGGLTIANLPYAEVRAAIHELGSGIQQGSMRIQRIVEGLKDFARREAPDRRMPIDLNRVVEAALVICGSLVSKSTRDFSFEPLDGGALVEGSFQQLEQVVINLVSNACQALEGPGQAVRVAVTADKGGFVLRVEDGGHGIDSALRERVFDPFFTTRRNAGGTGLGLSIAHQIVQAHGGSIRLEARGEGGTRVLVRLPAGREAAHD